ncbi:MAG: tetratricopeptide repeat protein [Methylococcaceae bacterium]
MITLSKKINIFSIATVLTGTLSLVACTSLAPRTEAEIETEGETKTEAETPAMQEAKKIDIFKSYQQAAAQGNARAQYNLGLWYEEDHPGQPRDMIRAYAWYKLSANQGSDDSRYALERFEAQLPSQQRAEAESLINKWTPGDTLEK